MKNLINICAIGVLASSCFGGKFSGNLPSTDGLFSGYTNYVPVVPSRGAGQPLTAHEYSGIRTDAPNNIRFAPVIGSGEQQNRLLRFRFDPARPNMTIAMFSVNPVRFSGEHPRDATLPSFTNQEALIHQRNSIRNYYIALATQEPSAQTIGVLLPSHEEQDGAFAECFEFLNDFYDQLLGNKTNGTTKFTFTNAQRTLRLINGDRSIEHHPISSVEKYSSYSYQDMPTTRQLLVLAWGLCEIDLKDFVKYTIAAQCDTPKKWQEWRKPFLNNKVFHEILFYEDFGQSLNADDQKKSPFIGSIVRFLQDRAELPATGTQKIMKSFYQALTMKKTEQLIPLTEALFMVMRGHNRHLMNQNEANNPACAEGAYLGILKSIAEMTPEGRFSPGIVLDNCG